MQTRDQMQQGRFAAAGRPHDTKKLSRLYLKINVIKRQHTFAGPRPIAETDVGKADLRNVRNSAFRVRRYSQTYFPPGSADARRFARIALPRINRWDRKLRRKIVRIRAH